MKRDKTQVRGVALITGAARRIGAVIAEELHGNGYDVVIHCHQSQAEAELLMQALNAKRADSASVCVADLSQKAEAEQLVHAAYAWKNQLDILVNNASCFIKTDVSRMDEAASDRLWALNVKGPFWLALVAYDALKQSDNGNIINITDIHAEKPLRDYAVYVQTKAALKMQTEALACEFAPDVRVNAVAPGAIILPEGDNALSAETQAQMLLKMPLKRWGEPIWVAKAVSSVVCNSYITGQTLRVDGGRSLK
ncbi:MAG: pteridine reductase [Gammaproteobacteria bacterium]|nr:pteridine reductase [Gammaproteobacteria bacterium]MCH9717181.1 pteridine reductase [Gammaproteobacteria bacterium]MCH9763089.1 pteridine reductase [Gammaproteobacteria bacterium]